MADVSKDHLYSQPFYPGSPPEPFYSKLEGFVLIWEAVSLEKPLRP